MNIKFFFTSIFITLFLSAFSQKAKIEIKVIDSQNNAPLEFVAIYAGGEGALTDSSGIAIISTDKGYIELKANIVGYEPWKQKVLTDNLSHILLIKMEPSNSLLNEVSVVSGRYERQLITEVASVEIVKPDLLKSNNLSSMEQLLNRIPGIQMIDGQANIRGGSGFAYGAGSRVLVTVDDVPAMQPDAGFPNWRDIPVENMSQVEVLKGAGSTLYGSTAMNGVINFRTAWAGLKPETSISTSFTGYLSPRDPEKKWWSKMPFESNTNIIHRNNFGKLETVFGANYFHSDSYNYGNYEHQGRIFINGRYKFNKNLILQVSSLFNKGNSDSFVYWQDGDKNAYKGDTTTYNPSKKFRYFIDPVLTYIGKHHNEHKIISRYFSINNDVDNGKSQKAVMKYIEYRYRQSFKRLGIEFTGGLVYTGTDVSAVLYGDTTYKALNLASYVSIDKVFFKKLTFNAGLRYEYNSLRSPEIVEGIVIPNGKTTESNPVFKFGLNYLINPYASVRASLGQGYRYPTIAEKFIKTTAGAIRVAPNPNLQSETGYTAEIGIKHGLKIASWNGFIDLAVFRSDYDNMMEFVLKNVSKGFQSYNIGDTRIQGIETSIQGVGQIGDFYLTTLAGYTHIDPKYRNFSEIDTLSSTVGYNVLKYRMKNSARVDLGLGYKRFEIGGYYEYNSKMLAIDKIFDFGIRGVHQFRATHDSGSHVYGFRFMIKLIEDKLKLGINLNNAFNAEYSIRPGLLEAPRNISARLDWKI
ncbi:MAG: TonB-dependent receptor [Saprospiraceae bacterium]|nr:TonB-dependent receptor [Saprospiraceae bacterium]